MNDNEKTSPELSEVEGAPSSWGTVFILILCSILMCTGIRGIRGGHLYNPIHHTRGR
jgi:hypothetical protein